MCVSVSVALKLGSHRKPRGDGAQVCVSVSVALKLGSHRKPRGDGAQVCMSVSAGVYVCLCCITAWFSPRSCLCAGQVRR